MSSKRIRDIQERAKGQPIEIRVLKKWIPLVKKNDAIQKSNDLCYQFVDMHGDAIEAAANASEVEYYDSIIRLLASYKVTNYMCTKRRPYMSTVDHEASLIIGKKARFVPIEGSNIPALYFNFATYSQLRSRIKDNKILTDYIGRVESNFLSPTTKNIILRKTLLQDERENKVEITLWPEMQYLYGDEVKPGDIIAITSTTVSNFGEMMQLESTYLSTVIINPDLPQTATHVNRLKRLQPIQPSETPEITLTVSQLEDDKLPNNKEMIRCKCYAKIIKTFEQRSWYYAQCSKCSNRLYPEEDETLTFGCKDHDDIEPKLMYSLNVLISDKTGNKEVVFFNEGLTALVKEPCQDLVLLKRNIDPKTLPKEIIDATKGPLLLHLTVKKGKTIVVNNASKVDPAAEPPQASSQQSDQSIPPATPDAKTSATKRPPPDTPDTSQKMKKAME